MQPVLLWFGFGLLWKDCKVLAGLMIALLYQRQSCKSVCPFKGCCIVSLSLSRSLLMDHHPSDCSDFCTLWQTLEQFLSGVWHPPTDYQYLSTCMCVCVCVVGMTKRFVKASASMHISPSLSDGVWVFSCRICVLQELTFPGYCTQSLLHQ